MCKRGPYHAYEALECLGGNGYTESFPLARRYREQPVLAVWEGSGNVIALDVLRAMAREPQALDAFLAELAAARGIHSLFDAHFDRAVALIEEAGTNPSSAERVARRMVEAMGLSLQAATLLRHAPADVAESFCHARLGADRGMEYGALPEGVSIDYLVNRT